MKRKETPTPFNLQNTIEFYVQYLHKSLGLKDFPVEQCHAAHLQQK